MSQCTMDLLELVFRALFRTCVKEWFGEPVFKRLLLRLYYLYEKSPKKVCELKSIIEDLRGTFEFNPLTATAASHMAAWHHNSPIE